MAKPPTIDTTIVPNRELAKIGSYTPSSGPMTLTRADLDDAVRAANDPNLRTPQIFLGHVGGTFDQDADDRPSYGRILNIRATETEDGGYALVGDFQVPTKLAALMPTAFPSRSIEGFANWQPNPMSPRYKLALTGVALLGETAPAIGSLNDLADLFGLDAGEPITATAGATPFTLTEEIPMASTVTASVQVPCDVRDQFYDELSIQNPGSWAYVSEVWNDFVIIEGTDGELYKVGWSEDGDSGVVTFEAPVRVHTEYVEDPDDELDTASGDHTPTSPFMLSGARVDLTSGTPVHVTTGAGRSEDMTDTTAAEVPTEAETVTASADDATSTETPTVTEPTTEIVAAAAPTGDPVAILASQLPSGFEIIASANLSDLRAAQVELAASKETTRISDRDSLIAGAAAEGRIHASQIEDLTALFDVAPEAVKALIAKAVPTVPVTAKGTSENTTTNPDQATLDAFLALPGGLI